MRVCAQYIELSWQSCRSSVSLTDERSPSMDNPTRRSRFGLGTIKADEQRGEHHAQTIPSPPAYLGPLEQEVRRAQPGKADGLG